MNRIKFFRKQRNMTQEQLAEKVGISKRTLLYWETGERTPKSDKAQQLADFFGVSVAYLLGYSKYSDSQEASFELNQRDPNDPYNHVKARIFSILGDNAFEVLQNNYVTGNYDDPDFSNFVSYLTAVNSLIYMEEETLLLNYGMLSRSDKQIVNNLVRDLANKDN